jgi:hypothetical protein
MREGATQVSGAWATRGGAPLMRGAHVNVLKSF